MQLINKTMVTNARRNRRISTLGTDNFQNQVQGEPTQTNSEIDANSLIDEGLQEYINYTVLIEFITGPS